MKTSLEFDVATLKHKLELVKESCEEAIAAIEAGKLHRLGHFQPDMTTIQRLIGRILREVE